MTTELDLVTKLNITDRLNLITTIKTLEKAFDRRTELVEKLELEKDEIEREIEEYLKILISLDKKETK